MQPHSRASVCLWNFSDWIRERPQSPASLALATGFVEDSFSSAGGWGWFQEGSKRVPFYCRLFISCCYCVSSTPIKGTPDPRAWGSLPQGTALPSISHRKKRRQRSSCSYLRVSVLSGSSGIQIPNLEKQRPVRLAPGLPLGAFCWFRFRLAAPCDGGPPQVGAQ